MRFRYLALLAILSLALMAPSASAAAQPQFFETTIVEDTPEDFAGDGALDLVAVHIAEKYQYNADQQVGAEIVTFRFQVRDIQQHKCSAVYRYDVNFKADGQAKNLYASLTSDPPTSPQSACQRKPGEGSGGVSLREPLQSILLVVPRDAVGPVGTVLTDIWASSSVVTPAQRVGQDYAPVNNVNQPSSQPPTTGLKQYASNGTYPFVVVVPVTPTEQYSVGGGEVKYSFQFFSHPDLKDDNIRVRFTFPEGWSISPSQGRTGSDPEGQLTGGNGGVPRDFAFTLSSSGAAAEGESVSVIMEVITDSGGHENITTVTTISGPKIVDPSLNFTLATPGPFRAGAVNPVRVEVANASGPLEGVVVSVDLIQNGRRISTTPLVAAAGGVYNGTVEFPNEGTYTLDAYISSLKPSPHQEFVVRAEGGGGLAPGAPIWLSLVLVLAIIVARRQNQ